MKQAQLLLPMFAFLQRPSSLMLISISLFVVFAITLSASYSASNKIAEAQQSALDKLMRVQTLDIQLKQYQQSRLVDYTQHWPEHLLFWQQQQVIFAQPLASVPEVHAQLAQFIITLQADQQHYQRLVSGQQKKQAAYQLIEQRKQAFDEVIQSGFDRLASFEPELPFEQLTANANRSVLFTALNHKKAKEEFVELQTAGLMLINAYRSLLESESSVANTQARQYISDIEEMYQAQIRAFVDTPTRMKLNQWLKQNDKQKLTPIALYVVQQNELDKLAQLSQSQATAQQLVKSLLAVNLQHSEVLQYQIKSALNRAGRALLINQLLHTLAMVCLLLLLFIMVKQNPQWLQQLKLSTRLKNHKIAAK